MSYDHVMRTKTRNFLCGENSVFHGNGQQVKWSTTNINNFHTEHVSPPPWFDEALLVHASRSYVLPLAALADWMQQLEHPEKENTDHYSSQVVDPKNEHNLEATTIVTYWQLIQKAFNKPAYGAQTLDNRACGP
jgi:hypothetical protein